MSSDPGNTDSRLSAPQKGLFITLEGGEGTGKTSQIGYIAEFLNKNGFKAAITREPGGTDIGTKIRPIVLNPESVGLLPTAELLLYMADRAQHLGEKVLPLMEKGVTVISDRYFDATLVYQGYARGLDMSLILSLHREMIRGVCKDTGGSMDEDAFEPDLTFLLDLAPEIGLKRAFSDVESGKRGTDESRFEQETLDFHETIRRGYLDLARKNSDRFRIIDASQNKMDVKNEIFSMLLEFINRR